MSFGPRPGTPRYRPPRPIADRLREKTVVTESGCWEFQGFLNATGYGVITTGSRVDGTYRPGHLVHRAAYEALVGPIPEGLTIDHLCENRACWNPEHLEPVTSAENTRRKGERMTHCRRGHERNEANTYVQSSGRRQCRVCERELAAEKRARSREVGAA